MALDHPLPSPLLKNMSLIIKKNTTFKIPRTPPISFLGLALWLKADTGVTIAISQIIISGFTGVYVGANGTYRYNGEEWYHDDHAYYIGSDGSLIDDIDQSVIATNNNNFQGAWTPTNYLSTITISNAGIPSENGVYTRSNEINFDSPFTASGGRSLNYDDNGGFWFTNPDGAYQNNDESLSVGGWFAVDDGGNITAVNSTSPRNIGSPTSTTVTDAVIAWADQSANGRNAYNNSGISGIPFLTTIGGNTFIEFKGAIHMTLPAIWQNTQIIGTIIVVVYFSSTGTILGHSTTTYNLQFGRGISGTTAFFLNLDSDPYTNYVISNVVVGSASKKILGATFDTSASFLYLNGASCGSGSGVNLIGSNSDFFVGRKVNPYSDSYKIGEVIIYNRVLTTEERQQVEAYLNSKYQIY